MDDFDFILAKYGTFTNNHDEANTLTYEKLMEAVGKIPKLTSEENIISIIITTLAPEEGIGKCQLKKGFHFLIKRKLWDKMFYLFRETPIDKNSFQTGFLPYMYGIPVFEDDDMARAVIVQANEYAEAEFRVIQERYMKNISMITGVPKRYFDATGS